MKMSTKASSLNASANNSPTNPTMNTSTTAITPTAVNIKKELPSDEIKEFAESTMNELLGWYGFDSVDRLDLSAKTSKLLQSAGIINSQQHQQQQQQQQQQHHMEKRRGRNSSRAGSLLHMQQQHQQQQRQNELLRNLNNNHNNHNNNNNISSNNNNINNNNNNSNSLNNNTSNNRKTSLNCNNNNNNNNNNYRGNESTTSDHDTRSSRDDDSKSPNLIGKMHSTTTNLIDEKLDLQNCCWCRRPVPENAPEFLTTSDGPRYCSESCFTQSRRASFKKAKTCDWCKHVRHAVSYVDFQDGASQLQFCSDKCLNQYKMQIFCKETQAHLDMNPHLKEQGLEAASSGANLITPDLWLRNCRSRSASPASTTSVSPGPAERVTNLAGTLSPLPKIAISNNLQHASSNNSSHKPLISVAPVSKLMSKSPSILPSRQSPKHNRKKRPVRSSITTEVGITRGSDVKVNCSSLAAGSLKPKSLMAPLNDNGRSHLNQPNTQTLTQFAASCVQDLHMNVPPLSPMMESQSSQPTTPHSLPPTPNRGPPTIPPAFFSTPPNIQGPQHSQPVVDMPPQGFPQRPPFLHNPVGGFLPRFMGNFAGLPPPPQAPAPLMQPSLAALSTLIGTPPPVTIMVPYPIIIPLPIPIPVPLPIVDFYKAYLTPEERKKFDEEQQMKKESVDTSTREQDSEYVAEEPLDFTKTKETNVETPCSNQQELPVLAESNEEFTCAKEEEISPRNSSPSEDSPNTPKPLHCVVTAGEPEAEQEKEALSTTKLQSDFVTNCQDLNEEDTNELHRPSGEETQQKLPKLKITRLQTKRTLIQTKESECSRPLRKRKRIIDCDFQKLNSANNNNNNNNNNHKESNDLPDELQSTTENESNKGPTTNNNNAK